MKITPSNFKRMKSIRRLILIIEALKKTRSYYDTYYYYSPHLTPLFIDIYNFDLEENPVKTIHTSFVKRNTQIKEVDIIDGFIIINKQFILKYIKVPQNYLKRDINELRKDERSKAVKDLLASRKGLMLSLKSS